MVKGDDYINKQVTGKEIVESQDGKLVFITRQYTTSTTDIIKQIELGELSNG